MPHDHNTDDRQHSRRAALVERVRDEIDGHPLVLAAFDDYRAAEPSPDALENLCNKILADGEHARRDIADAHDQLLDQRRHETSSTPSRREQLTAAARTLLRSALLIAWFITKPFAWLIDRVRAYPLAAAALAFLFGTAVTIYATRSVRESLTPVAFELPERALPHFAKIHAVRHAGRVFVDTREPGVVFLETITDDGRIAAIYKCAASNPPPPRVEDVLVVAKAPSPALGPRTTVDPRILYDCRHQPDAVAHLKSRYADGRPIPVASARLPTDPRYKSIDAADAAIATVRRARPHNVPDAATIPVEPPAKP